MTFRYFLVAFVTLATFLFSGCAQRATSSSAVYHLAVIASGQSRLVKAESLEKGLADRGYRPGENLIVTIFNAENQGDRLPELTQQALMQHPDVLVTLGGVETQTAKKLATNDGPPIVFIGVAATVDWGVVDSFQHPGHNMTGVDNGYIEITSKRLEFLTLLLPATQRVLVLYSPHITPSLAALREAQWAATRLNLTLIPQPVDGEASLERFANALQPGMADAILVTPCYTLENALPTVLLPAASRARIPIMGLNQDIVAAGGLAAYGASFQSMGYQAARLVDKALSGVPAGDIPVEFPDTPEFSINMQTAREMRLHLNDDTVRLGDRFFPEGTP